MALSVRPQFNAWDREGQARSTLEAQFGFGQAVAENSVAGFLSSFGIGTLVREGTTPQPVREYDPNAPLWTIPNPFSDAAKTAGAIGAVIRGDKPEPAITEEEFAASPDWRKQIPYETGMTKSRLAALAAQYDVAEARAMMSQKEWGGAFIGQFLGQMLDPINYVPFTGPAVQTAAVARAGGILGRIGVAATDAAISTAVFGAATAEWRRKFGDDISFEAMAQEIGMSMVIGGVFGAGLGVLSIPTDRRARDAAIIDAAATRMNSLRDVQGRQAILSDSTSRLAAGLEMNPAARVEFERQAAKFQDEIRIQEERDIGRVVEARTVAQRAEIAAAKVELEAIPAETPRAVELSKRVMELEDYVQRVDTVYRAQRELVARGVAFEPDVAARAAEAPPVADGTTRLYTATDPAAGQPVAASVEAPAKGDGWYMDVPTEQAAELTARPIEPPAAAKTGEAGPPGVQPMAWQQLPKIEAPPVSPFRRLMINRFMEGGRSGEEGLALAKTFEAAYANLSARAGWTPEKMLQEYPMPEVVYRAPERAPEPKAEEGVPVFDDGKPHFYDGPAENAPDGRPLASETEMLFAPPTSVADVPTVARSEGTLASGIEALDPETVTVDAKRFQFKEGGDEFGVTDRLQGVETWDERLAGTSLVFRDADGKNWVADGHQRFGLAKRLMASGHPPIKVNAFVLDATNGYTDASARAIAAVKNIAEGTGTAVDAAKVLRAAKDSGIDLPPLPPRSALVRDGRALAELSPDAFGMVVNEVVPAAYGAIIGRMVKNPLQQTEAVRIIATLKPDNARQVELVVRDMLASGTEQLTRQGGLFGAEDFAQSIVLERAKIADEALKQIRQDKRTFGTLVSEAERIELQGNTLSRSANEARLSTDEKAAELLTQLAFRAGPVSDTLSEVARKLKLGQLTASAAAREFLGTVRSAVESGLDTGADVGGAGSRAADDGVTPRDPDTIEMFQSARWRLGDKLGMFDTEPGLEGLPQALIPGVAPIDETARMRAAAAKPLRGGDAPMKEGSLFDVDSDKQLTLFQSAPPTDTPAFRAWFGSSKVVDADGKPLVVYHGGAKGIEAFDPAKIGTNFELDEDGFFFTSDGASDVPGSAKTYASRLDEGDVYPVYLKIEKPYTLEQFAADLGTSYEGLTTYGGELQPPISIFDDSRIDAIKFAKAAGSDGIIFEIRDGDFREALYVAFSPTQIKSVANRGTFDPNDPRILYQPAYHGSPHIFDRFEWSDKTRGKGEGAQAFGDGLYFAGKKEVAQYYKETLTEYHVGPAKRVLAKADGDVDAAIAATETEIARLAALNLTEASGSSTRDAKMRGRQAELAELTAYRDTGKWRTSGRLYKVDIPHDDELMMWDAPLSEQSPKVREAMGQVIRSAPKGSKLSMLGRYNDDTVSGEEFYRALAETMGRKAPEGSLVALVEPDRLLPDEAAASKALHDAGIPGHRFLDQGSRADGEGTYNYVIYDDSRVDIIDYEQAVRDDATLWELDTGRNADETPRGQIKFKNGQPALMSLFDGADPSTALHEAGHHFLMMIKDMGERTDTGPGIKEDWAQVKGWLAVNAKDVATEAGNDVTPDDVLAVLNRNTSGDKMKDIAINRGIHEQWARGFEAYHLEGKAPSAGMRGVFESFRKWLAAIYASVKSLNVNLTPEIRQVFDRLLTDEPTVERAVVTAPERPATAMNLDPPQPELPDAPLVEAGARAGKSEDVAGFEEQIGAKVDGTYNEEGDIDMLRSLGRVLPEEEVALKQADDGYKDALAYEKAIQVALACVIS